MENIATAVKYTWNLIAEYKTFRASDVSEEQQLATLLRSALIKFLGDYINPPDDTQP